MYFSNFPHTQNLMTHIVMLEWVQNLWCQDMLRLFINLFRSLNWPSTSPSSLPRSLSLFPLLCLSHIWPDDIFALLLLYWQSCFTCYTEPKSFKPLRSAVPGSVSISFFHPVTTMRSKGWGHQCVTVMGLDFVFTFDSYDVNSILNLYELWYEFRRCKLLQSCTFETKFGHIVKHLPFKAKVTLLIVSTV